MKINYLLSIKILFFLLFYFPALLSAQHENDNWYMGINLGMQFNGNQPAKILTDSKMHSPYASASISDKKTGKLLFYTNGDNVWNVQHQIMPSGSGLLGTYCMEVIIVPVPGNDLRYYIFYISNIGPLYYAEVDMSLGGRLGDVVYKKKVLATNLESFFTVVKHEYGNGYWLVGHERASWNFTTFRITENGIDLTPVLSKGVLPTIQTSVWKGGHLISSNDGRKLAIGGENYGKSVSVYKFDKVCGKVGNSISGGLSTCGYATGIAFSPTDTYIYATSYCPSTGQYKLEQSYPNIYQINIITTNDGLREMRLGPDDKIYIVTSENGAVTSKLDVILFPDKLGASCEYKKYYHRLHPGSISYFTEHLPNFINDKSDPKNLPSKPEISISEGCIGETINIILNNAPKDLDSFVWEFGDGTFFTNYKPANSVSKIYNKPGKYLIKYKWYVCGYEYSVEKEIEIAGKPTVNLGNDTTICAGTPFVLNANNPGAKYIWSNGSKDSAITVRQAGKYYVKVSNGNCTATDSIEIKYYPEIWTALGEEYFICEEEKELAKLDAGKAFESYLWQPTGDTSQWIVVSKADDYYVIVKDFRGCEGQDGTIVKRKCPGYLHFPNAFSPNYDGLNDEYKPVAQDILNFKIKIYNRWGEKVFESNDINKGWDGKYRGIKAPDGVYFYLSNYSGYGRKQAFQNLYKSGYFTLFR